MGLLKFLPNSHTILLVILSLATLQKGGFIQLLEARTHNSNGLEIFQESRQLSENILPASSYAFLFPTWLSELWTDRSSGESRVERKLQATSTKQILEFDLIGNVLKRYLLPLNIGVPVRTFYIQADTSTDLVWVPCKESTINDTDTFVPTDQVPYNSNTSTTFKSIRCREKICSSNSSLSLGCGVGVNNGINCEYNDTYYDGGISLGELMIEATTGKFKSGNALLTSLYLGCGEKETISEWQQRPIQDGVAGLGRGGLSLVSQLAKQGLIEDSFTLCLEGDVSSSNGGKLALGASAIPTANRSVEVRGGPEATQYFVGIQQLFINTTRIPRPFNAYFVRTSEKRGAIFDSGAPVTLLPEEVYKLWKEEFLRQVTFLVNSTSAYRLPELECFDAPFFINTNELLVQHFPPARIVFLTDNFSLHPYSYLVVPNAALAPYTVCLGMRSSGPIGTRHPGTVIGATWLRNKVLSFDRTEGKIYWSTDYNCTLSAPLQIKRATTPPPVATSPPPSADAPPPALAPEASAKPPSEATSTSPPPPQEVASPPEDTSVGSPGVPEDSPLPEAPAPAEGSESPPTVASPEPSPEVVGSPPIDEGFAPAPFVEDSPPPIVEEFAPPPVTFDTPPPPVIAVAPSPVEADSPPIPVNSAPPPVVTDFSPPIQVDSAPPPVVTDFSPPIPLDSAPPPVAETPSAPPPVAETAPPPMSEFAPPPITESPPPPTPVVEVAPPPTVLDFSPPPPPPVAEPSPPLSPIAPSSGSSCPPSPSSCAFFFEGSEGSIPTFSMEGSGGDVVVGGPIQTRFNGSVVSLASGNTGPGTFQCPSVDSEAEDAGDQFYITQSNLMSRTFNSEFDTYVSHIIRLPITNAQLIVNGQAVNINIGDGNEDFPGETRCMFIDISNGNV